MPSDEQVDGLAGVLRILKENGDCVSTNIY